MRYALTLDVGGTQIKACAVQEGGHLEPSTFGVFDARSQEDRETVLQNFLHILTATIHAIPDPHKQIAGIGFAFPGDFDYPAGICLIQGIAKYDAIYQVNLRHELGQRIAASPLNKWFLPTSQMVFLNDAEAFALGEYHFGGHVPCGRTMALCIGTGAGSAFLTDGMPAAPGTPGVPNWGWIYDTPFRDSILDDYLSRRGLLALSRQLLGEALDGKALAQRCAKGDPGAQEAYRRFGQLLAEGLSPFLEAFQPQLLLLGGQVTRSWELFGQPLENACQHRGIHLSISQDTSRAAFLGACYALTNFGKTRDSHDLSKQL